MPSSDCPLSSIIHLYVHLYFIIQTFLSAFILIFIIALCKMPYFYLLKISHVILHLSSVLGLSLCCWVLISLAGILTCLYVTIVWVILTLFLYTYALKALNYRRNNIRIKH